MRNSIYAWFQIPILLGLVLYTKQTAFAADAVPEEYVLLSGLGNLGSVNTNTGFIDFINVLYTMAIGLGSALAVLMIIWAGTKYMISVSAGQKTELRNRIMGALGGLVFLLASYLLLSLINPQLVALKGFGGSGSGTQQGTSGSGTNVGASSGNTLGGGTTTPDPDEEPEEPTGETPAGNILQNGFYVLEAGDPRLSHRIDVNQYRTYRDFADKNGDGSLRISARVVGYDKVIQDKFNARHRKTIRIASAYRKAGRSGAGNNHPAGESIDYSTFSLSETELASLQEFLLESNVVRVGFGNSNNHGTHAQWGGNKIYWCYDGLPGPFKGRGSMPGYSKAASSCSY